jgi:hypothetical protein
MLFPDQAQIFFLFNSGFFLNAEKHIKKNPNLLPLPPYNFYSRSILSRLILYILMKSKDIFISIDFFFNLSCTKHVTVNKILYLRSRKKAPRTG